MDVSPSKVLTFGIVALATCETGILGIVFGALARKNAQAYIAAYGTSTGQVRTGNILGTFGLVFGIIMTVVWGIVSTSCIFSMF